MNEVISSDSISEEDKIGEAQLSILVQFDWDFPLLIWLNLGKFVKCFATLALSRVNFFSRRLQKLIF